MPYRPTLFSSPCATLNNTADERWPRRPKLSPATLVCVFALFGGGCLVYGAQLPEQIESESSDSAAADTGFSPDLELVDGGNRFGECVGSCRFEISFQSTVLQLKVSDYAASQEFGVNYGLLTDEGQMTLAALNDTLASASLLDLYGCPDCDDGGASWVRIDRPAGVSDHLYERGNPPPELVDYDSFVQEMIVALQTCVETSLVVPDENCESIP